MRIIAGMAKGIPLATPTSDKTRPTSDRVKEAIFSALENHIDLDGTRVIDLFAGTGALGLEAISRGSISCTFVEKAQDMCKVIKTNIEKVEKAVSQYETMPPVFEVVNKEVSSVIQTLSLSKGLHPLGRLQQGGASTGSAQTEERQPYSAASSRAGASPALLATLCGASKHIASSLSEP